MQTLPDDVDLQESIVAFVGEPVMMLIEYVENNCLPPDLVLATVRDLIVHGEHKVDTGNGTEALLKIVKWNSMSAR